MLRGILSQIIIWVPSAETLNLYIYIHTHTSHTYRYFGPFGSIYYMGTWSCQLGLDWEPGYGPTGEPRDYMKPVPWEG